MGYGTKPGIDRVHSTRSIPGFIALVQYPVSFHNTVKHQVEFFNCHMPQMAVSGMFGDWCF